MAFQRPRPIPNPEQEAEVLVPRPSILLPQLQACEQEFFDLVASGKQRIDQL